MLLFLQSKHKKTENLAWETAELTILIQLFDVEPYAYIQVEAEGRVLIVGGDVASIVEVIAHAWFCVDAKLIGEIEFRTNTSIY